MADAVSSCLSDNGLCRARALGTILRATLVPNLQFTPASFFLITGVLWITITAYIFFWEASQEVEEERSRGVLQAGRPPKQIGPEFNRGRLFSVCRERGRRLAEGLNLNVRREHGFYGVIALGTLVSLAINFIGLNPVKIAGRGGGCERDRGSAPNRHPGGHFAQQQDHGHRPKLPALDEPGMARRHGHGGGCDWARGQCREAVMR
jgi:hypothetical protein